ncbi:hypothetical protein N5923_08835 [Erwiniaceae bacterium BAC15a-03b]|uniref:DUF6966 domain-containing protein n=1 Tax=Winslowiella arboricola TaxID=2978220 RepID=A0A9J6PS90_9GAMM|nr:hypothetical protein [Winslowiella arboricola]MCU5771733.1 hypothetical protein [Winslowiella arboricola]MCU5777596.1 hypothetical protein [Winslowiella arboricola]
MISEQKKYLKSIAELLRDNGEYNLVKTLDNLYSRADTDPDQFIDDVKRLFGGMGTLNDIVFSKNGRPLIEENNKLEELRRKLYSACSSYKYIS